MTVRTQLRNTTASIVRGGLALLLVTALISGLMPGLLPGAYARDETTSVPVQGLVAFASDEGMARFVRASAKVDFPALANQ